MKDKSYLCILFDYLSNVINKKPTNLITSDRRNVKLYYYYSQIIRNFNKLNYIVNNICKKRNGALICKDLPRELLIFLTFRAYIEESSKSLIIKELEAENEHLFKSNYVILAVKYLNILKHFDLKKSVKHLSLEERLSIETSIPSFTIKKLLKVMPSEFLIDNINFMEKNVKEFFTIRINRLRRKAENRDIKLNILRELSHLGIKFTEDEHFEDLIHISSKFKRELINSKQHKHGDIVIHDKASYAVSSMIQPESNEIICDLCAAPGIKTSVISQLAHNMAYIVGNDFNLNRLTSMKSLVSKLSTNNIFIINTDSIDAPFRLDFKLDKVLLDAPCTGSGTFGTNPELILRQSNKFLRQNIIIQEKLIQSGLRLLKSNGVFVYSTCSLYPEEGELQIRKFLDKLMPLTTPKWLSPSYKIDRQTIPGTARLFPSIHRTLGFFLGRFKKKAE